jgi:Fe-S-cluster containining protein
MKCIHEFILQPAAPKCYNQPMPDDAASRSQHASVCFHCGECCTRYQVLLEQPEMQQIAAFLGITLEKLKSGYTDPRWPVPGKFLLKHRDNGGCIFLIHRGKEALCSIHVAKPRACRDWSPGISRKECSQGLSRVWGLAANENGEMCGLAEDKAAFAAY